MTEEVAWIGGGQPSLLTSAFLLLPSPIFEKELGSEAKETEKKTMAGRLLEILDLPLSYLLAELF